jgi:phospholipid transport system substrate-binding protein
MNRLDSLISGFVAISLLLFSLNTQGADSPQATIQTAVQKTLAVLQDPSLQGATHRQERLAKAEKVILAYFDTQQFAQRALGQYWSQRTPAEQQEFVGLFTTLVVQSYMNEIDRQAKDVKLFYDKQEVDGTDAEVHTRVLSPSEHEPVSVNYIMHQSNGRWLIYDVQIDDVSIVLNYRSQFRDVLNKSSYTDLIQLIRSKLQ